MNVVAFEDRLVARLGVVAVARPACDITVGSHTLVELLGHVGGVRRAVRPHLARHLAGLAGRIAVWGGPPDAAPRLPASRHGAVSLLVNARVVPSRANLVALRSLVESGRRCVVRSETAVAAAVLHLSATGGADDAAVDAIAARGTEADEALAPLGLPEHDLELNLLEQVHDVVTQHEAALEGSLAVRLDGGGYTEIRPGLFVAAGARVADWVAVRQGPVVVERGAEVGPFVCIDGPAWIGPEARVSPHAWLRPGTVLGRACRVGGEVEASVMEPYSNKPHDGYLGHSHVGSWANLAAGTVTGNLKATYGPVRLHDLLPDGGRATIHTGRQFLGAMVGDFVKSAVNTSLSCGARIGVAATIGGSPPEFVPAFHNMLVGGPAGSRSTPEQAATILGRMMARRGLEMLPADRELLEALAAPAPRG
jgi:UDP-N-acetylglucosamine diphosphorylase/glucosamine-1-phosphate N-acetyltransferase